MVANVWKVVASEDNHVDDGDTLVILESMKMEIRWSWGPGVVADARRRDNVVQEGDLIAVIS